MNVSRLDGLARRVSARSTRRTSLALLAGASLPLFGRPGISDARKNKQKITLCANGQTVRVTKQKAKKLQRQGAGKGDCRCGNGGACTAFHTVERFTGSAVGGLAGADATCTALANGAGIAGTFKAWLSAGNASPATRFDTIGLAGPWVLPRIAADGASPPTVAANFQDLITCGATCLRTAINRNQHGGAGDGAVVWTATRADGSAAATNCSSWTSDDGEGLTGLAAQTDTAWTDSTVTFGCNLTFSLYCFQQAT